jgi:hypothetical protein
MDMPNLISGFFLLTIKWSFYLVKLDKKIGQSKKTFKKQAKILIKI